LPELPEVETIARSLRQGSETAPALVGMLITRAEVLWQRSLATPAAEFYGAIGGQTILAIGRRGKFLQLTLTQHALLIHLRMSGDLWVEGAHAPLHQHHRVLFSLAEGAAQPPAWRLAFNDPRKFGRVWFTASPQAVLSRLGPEPLDEDFTPAGLHLRLQACRRQIKPLLMDQHFLAGMGNIYTDEALYRARIHPLTLSHTLDEEQTQRLWSALRAVLQEGIQRNGASIDWVYRGGAFQNTFNVYQRQDKPCPVCGAPIRRTIIGQRSSHFCPVCQPEPRQAE